VSFGTKLWSDATSPNRGVGAARQWIYDELKRSSSPLQVSFDTFVVAAQNRMTRSTEILAASNRRFQRPSPLFSRPGARAPRPPAPGIPSRVSSILLWLMPPRDCNEYHDRGDACTGDLGRIVQCAFHAARFLAGEPLARRARGMIQRRENAGIEIALIEHSFRASDDRCSRPSGAGHPRGECRPGPSCRGRRQSNRPRQMPTIRAAFGRSGRPSSSAQSTSRTVSGGRPLYFFANPLSTSRPDSVSRQPSSHPPICMAVLSAGNRQTDG
jgi:hypothetical protein